MISDTRAQDLVGLEILRTRLQAIADESAITIERTAISPVAVEAKDYSCTLLDDRAHLLMGGGYLDFHFHAASSAVTHTLEIHGDTLAPGDVFLSNDPHSGGGCHAQDVLVQRPIFVGNELAAWVVNSAHLMDMGGMAFGSWAPGATECYQEALRFPPVHLFRAGREEVDIWAILRNNVRVADLVEMDLRALVAGCHVAQQKFEALVAPAELDHFKADMEILSERSARAFRQRVAAIEDGVYVRDSWVDWAGELYALPCQLTVDGDHLLFDFTGAASQCVHYFNSKPYIVKSFVGTHVHALLANDLPLSQVVFDAIDVRCPTSSITNADPPAPVGSAHMEVGGTAGFLAAYCLQLALAASAEHEARRFVGASTTTAFVGLQAWSGQGLDGSPDGWMMLDGIAGSPAVADRDGTDLCNFLVGSGGYIEQIDVEVLESWYPLLVERRGIRTGPLGAGSRRAGAGCEMSYRPYGTPGLTGVMIGLGDTLPGGGWAGGQPGGVTEFRVRRSDGTVEHVSTRGQNIWLGPDDTFELRVGSAGGFGDPLDRAVDAVAADVASSRLTADDAFATYGVVLDDQGQPDLLLSDEARAAARRARLTAAIPATCAVDPRDAAHACDLLGQPLYPGVEQRGDIAFCTISSTPLAVAPAHWTDGCPTLEEISPTVHGGRITTRTYLDPLTGAALFVDVVPDDGPRSMTTAPRRWTEAKR